MTATKGFRTGMFTVYSAFIMGLFMAAACQAIDQASIDNMAANLDLRFDVISNDPTGCHISLTFTNKGYKAIESGRWAIYFSSLRAFDQYSLTAANNLTVQHINGYLHKLEPTNQFKNLMPRKSFRYFLNAQNAMVSKSDVMPNWYVAAGGLEPRLIESTAGESLKFVGSFDTPSKWKRSTEDTYDPFTPAKRFQLNNIADLKRIGNLIVPTPLEIQFFSKSQRVDFKLGGWSVAAPEGLVTEARYLAKKLNIKLGKSWKPTKIIKLSIGAVFIKNKASENEEAYNLFVDPINEVIRIVGKSSSGVFWGIQSLLSLENDGEVPWVTVEDAPRYEYRGLSMDVARNFLPKDDVMKMFDGMAMYKMNKFHFHLTDDEGWRLEIPGLPELTQVASKRCHDLHENTCITPQLGSGPFKNTSGSGYYTVDDYLEILQYAKERHIEVIPEFDLPGHSHAGITAMNVRRDKFRGRGDAKDGIRFYLNDLKDSSVYQSGQYFRNNAVNPCVESTYDFVEKLVYAVRNLHSEIQPLNVIHLGGDEVPPGAWLLSPACDHLSKKLKLQYPTWKAFFTQRVAAIAGKYGLNLGLWEDGLVDTGTPIDRKKLNSDLVYGYAWGNTLNLGYKLANAGYKVVMAQASHLYFDHPYEPDPLERGTYWATRYTDTRKTFGFMPEHLYESQEADGNGVPVVDYCQTAGCVKPSKSENIVGLEAAIWSETIRTPAQFQSMTFPRLLAIAERAWHKDSWENYRDKETRNTMKKESWQKFANSIGHKELARLDKLGIAYRVPLPGARVVDGVLRTNVAFPGLKVEFSIDGGQTWNDSGSASVVSGTVLLRTRSADGKRTSRIARTKLTRSYQTSKSATF